MLLILLSCYSARLGSFRAKAHVDGMRKGIAKNVKLWKVDALEEIAFSWSYWDKRRAEEVQTK